MYGTVMVGRFRGERADAEQGMSAWLAERAPHVKGFVDAGLMFSDDGQTIVNWARFTDREAYRALGDDPEQDRWYRERVAPHLDGEPQWIDGDWADLQVPSA